MSCSTFNFGNGVFMLNKAIIFNNRSQLKIIGNINTSIECTENTGLAFKYVSNIEILNVSFCNCGMIFNSTSQYPISNNSTLTSKAGILFQYCINISLESIVVKSSDGVGIQMYNTIGKVYISHSNFSKNRVKETYFTLGGGGLYIEFSLCDPGSNGKLCNI